MGRAGSGCWEQGARKEGVATAQVRKPRAHGGGRSESEGEGSRRESLQRESHQDLALDKL